MARYINADYLKHDIVVLFKNNEELIDRWLAYIVDDIIDEHEKCGGVDLVRCKDCKNFDICSVGKNLGKDGFCSKGK